MIKTSPDVRRLATTLQTSPTLNVPWDWEVMPLAGDTTMQERDELFARMESQDCWPNEPALFLIMKGGTGEDSWNPNCNALIDMNQQMFLDGYEFLQQQRADEACVKQRAGRVGRHRRGLLLNISDDAAPGQQRVECPEGDQEQAWVMPYFDRLSICLAAAALHHDDELPGLSRV